jgi:hypothetical protein
MSYRRLIVKDNLERMKGCEVEAYIQGGYMNRCTALKDPEKVRKP